MRKVRFSQVIKAERAIASAWTSFGSIEGTDYQIDADSKSVTVYADDEAALSKAVFSLCGPPRFEVITPVDSSPVVYFHCPHCLTSLEVGHSHYSSLIVVIERVEDTARDHALTCGNGVRRQEVA